MNNTVLPPAEPTSEQLTGLSMVEWAVALRERRLTAVECLEQHLERIAQANPAPERRGHPQPVGRVKKPRLRIRPRRRAGSSARSTGSRSR